MIETRKLRVFLSYAREDQSVVRELYDRLNTEGWIDLWFDEASLFAGQYWKSTIEASMENSDVIIIFLSNQSINKKGFVQREMRDAYTISLFQPENIIFLIPIRLDECIPPRSLKDLHYMDFFGENKDKTYNKLIQTLEKRKNQILELESLELKSQKEEEQRKREAKKAKREKRKERLERKKLTDQINYLEDVKTKLEGELLVKDEVVNKYSEEIENIKSNLLETQGVTTKEKEEKEDQIYQFQKKLQIEQISRKEIEKKMLEEIENKKRIEDELAFMKLDASEKRKRERLFSKDTPYKKIIQTAMVIGTFSIPIQFIIMIFGFLFGGIFVAVAPFLTGAFTSYRLAKAITDIPKALAIKIGGMGGALSGVPLAILFALILIGDTPSEYFTIQEELIITAFIICIQLVIGMLGGWTASYLSFYIQEYRIKKSFE
ncbi:MAG TPA: hypothetical protein DHW49_07500 [Anaerolineae bacterium]|nr:hypothetical protein [Flavobacterium sp.]HCK66096.1 hypothetical protein [Anaerolineae bacterium]